MEIQSVEEQSATNPFAGGGIAAAAAAAAAKRKIAKNASTSQSESPSMNISAVGIAAARAFAAAKRDQGNAMACEEIVLVDEKAATNPFAGGGIAAAAAAAAAKRNNAKNASTTEAESPSMNPSVGGGIAAARAFAAAKYDEVTPMAQEGMQFGDEKTANSPFAGGGIAAAAAAAAAAAKRSQSQVPDRSGEKPPTYPFSGGGMAEVTASESWEISKAAGGKTNNMATYESDDESLSMNPRAIFAGGAISAAAEAATFKFKEVHDSQPFMSQTSIRYMAKTSSIARQMSVSTNVVEDGFSHKNDLVLMEQASLVLSSLDSVPDAESSLTASSLKRASMTAKRASVRSKDG